MSTEITASLVKELRERTNAPMMDCKKALVATGGDIEKAVEEMRKAGQAKADKKSSRVAAEGIIVINSSPDRTQAVMLEINSETDFVAREENFLAFAESLAQVALKEKPQSPEELLMLTAPGTSNKTFEEVRKELIAKIGENIQIRRLVILGGMKNGATYIHGSRIGVIVDAEGGNESLAKDIALHIAASAPIVVRPEEVSAETIAKEREIYKAQAMATGKPEAIAEKMVEGRVKKFLGEVSLLGQPFVKNPDQSVADYLKASNAQVHKFARFMVGEGIEKEQVNFADEVRAQVEALKK